MPSRSFLGQELSCWFHLALSQTIRSVTQGARIYTVHNRSVECTWQLKQKPAIFEPSALLCPYSIRYQNIAFHSQNGDNILIGPHSLIKYYEW